MLILELKGSFCYAVYTHTHVCRNLSYARASLISLNFFRVFDYVLPLLSFRFFFSASVASTLRWRCRWRTWMPWKRETGCTSTSSSNRACRRTTWCCSTRTASSRGKTLFLRVCIALSRGMTIFFATSGVSFDRYNEVCGWPCFSIDRYEKLFIP